MHAGGCTHACTYTHTSFDTAVSSMKADPCPGWPMKVTLNPEKISGGLLSH